MNHSDSLFSRSLWLCSVASAIALATIAVLCALHVVQPAVTIALSAAVGLGSLVVGTVIDRRAVPSA